MIWFTSDLHLCHDHKSVYAARGFRNVDDMNETIIMNWSKVVDDDDDIYILGDLVSHDYTYGLQLISLLPGKKHIILGNHDTERRVRLYESSGLFESIKYADVIFTKSYAFYISHYATLCTVFQNSRYFVSLCGHMHTTNKWLDWDKGLIYHVEVDAHNFFPVSLDTILNEIDEKRKGYSK